MAKIPLGSFWNVYLQHQKSDCNGKDPVAKRFQPLGL